MPPPASGAKRMTANPVRPARYRPGKGVEVESSSEEEEEVEEDDQQPQDSVEEERDNKTQRQQPVAATSFRNVKDVDLKSRQAQARQTQEQARLEEFKERERLEKEAGFVTESEDESGDEEDAPPKAPAVKRPPTNGEESDESGSDEDEESSDEDSSEEESSSEDEKPRMMRPVFIKKSQRAADPPTTEPLSTYQTEEQALELANRRRADADALIQAELDRKAAAKAAAHQDWDADDTGVADEDAVDDTDGLDAELEHKLWVARELGRLKRDRAALEAHEAELAEVERRRGLSAPEREAEDRAHIQAQQDERAARGKMAHLQKYHHRGAFYADEGAAAGLAARDLMGARFVDQADKSGLPEYLQRRDETKIGKKGATRYKDMRSEDTGRFGDFARAPDRRPRDAGERESERTGANASALGAKRKVLSTGEAMREEAKKLRTE